MGLGKISEEAIKALSVLKTESEKSGSHRDLKRIFTVKYPASVEATSDHDSLAKLIFLQDYIAKFSSKEEKPLSETQSKVLAYYVIRGNCDRESRKALAIMLNKEATDVHSYNHTLVKCGYLEKIGFKTGTFAFSKKFKILQDYWKKCKEADSPLTFLVEIQNNY